MLRRLSSSPGQSSPAYVAPPFFPIDPFLLYVKNIGGQGNAGGSASNPVASSITGELNPSQAYASGKQTMDFAARGAHLNALTIGLVMRFRSGTLNILQLGASGTPNLKVWMRATLAWRLEISSGNSLEASFSNCVADRAYFCVWSLLPDFRHVQLYDTDGFPLRSRTQQTGNISIPAFGTRFFVGQSSQLTTC